jgi:dipeptidase E
MRRHLLLAGGGSASREREVWRIAFAGVHKVVYWPFALPDERVSSAPGWLRGALAELGIQAEVDAWVTLEGRTAAELEPADLLFVGGGVPSKLLEHIRDHGFRDHVVAFVAQGGRYYGGSAGALIAGDSIAIAALAGDDAGAAGSPAGLGLFSGVTVLPHADTFAPADIQSWARDLGQRVVAIPEAGGLDIRDDRWTVVGPGSAMLAHGDDHRIFPPGSSIPLDA